MSALFIVKAVSVCGTYKETLKCLTMDEAQRYKTALEAEGWKVSVIATRSAS